MILFVIRITGSTNQIPKILKLIEKFSQGWILAGISSEIVELYNPEKRQGPDSSQIVAHVAREQPIGLAQLPVSYSRENGGKVVSMLLAVLLRRPDCRLRLAVVANLLLGFLVWFLFLTDVSWQGKVFDLIFPILVGITSLLTLSFQRRDSNGEKRKSFFDPKLSGLHWACIPSIIRIYFNIH